MQSLAASTAVKTAPAAATVRSASAASSGQQKTEHSTGPSVAQHSVVQNRVVQNGESQQQEQRAVSAYADEQALRQQQVAAEQAATAQLTEAKEPASADPAAEWSGLSQPLSAEELALLYRQPLLSPLLPASSHQAATAAAMPDLLPQSAAVASLGAASLVPVTLPAAQTLAEPVLTERQQPALYHQPAASSLQALPLAFLPIAGNASQTSAAETPLSPLLVSQTAAAHSTLQQSSLQHSSLPPALALTSLLNQQFNMVTANTASFTSNDASLANPLATQATTTTSALAQWQSEPLPTDPARFGQRLLQLLQDKVDLQLGLGLNKALIRLDPPSLGSVELSVQLDGDKLQVQLHSSNAQLREAMGQGLEQLRASLQQKLGSELQIDLQLSADGQLAREAHPAWQAEQISANAALSESAEPVPAAMVEGRNYLNQLV